MKVVGAVEAVEVEWVGEVAELCRGVCGAGAEWGGRGGRVGRGREGEEEVVEEGERGAGERGGRGGGGSAACCEILWGKPLVSAEQVACSPKSHERQPGVCQPATEARRDNRAHGRSRAESARQGMLVCMLA